MTSPWLQPLDFGPLLRAARHIARLSQRELAAASGVSQRQICRIETGESRPLLSAAAILLSAMDCRLEALGPTGSPLEPLTHDRERDEARRHFPAHVDLRSTEHWGSWWLDRAPIGEFMRRPDWTFDRPAIPPFEDWLTAE